MRLEEKARLGEGNVSFIHVITFWAYCLKISLTGLRLDQVLYQNSL